MAAANLRFTQPQMVLCFNTDLIDRQKHLSGKQTHNFASCLTPYTFLSGLILCGLSGCCGCECELSKLYESDSINPFTAYRVHALPPLCIGPDRKWQQGCQKRVARAHIRLVNLPNQVESAKAIFKFDLQVCSGPPEVPTNDELLQ